MLKQREANMEEQFKKLKDNVDACEGCNGVLGNKLDALGVKLDENQKCIEANAEELGKISKNQIQVLQHLSILVGEPII